MIGTTLSHYKIIEKLGQGGQGEVYLAEDSRLDRKVALKILPQHLSERAEVWERFEREAKLLASLFLYGGKVHKVVWFLLLFAFGCSSTAIAQSWYNADIHIHASNGCPGFFRDDVGSTAAEILGLMKQEGINVGSVLVFGGRCGEFDCLEVDSVHFRGQEDDPVSEPNYIVHWDIEISALPGAWHGHMDLLNVAQKDAVVPNQVNYPGQDYLLPNYQYVQSQGGIVGYGHGQGWTPGSYSPSTASTKELPLDVALARVDFLAAERMNDGFYWIWYSMLNAGFHLPPLGTSDLECIWPVVGTYHAAFPLPTGDTLTYTKFTEAVREGRTVIRRNNSPPDYLDIRVNGMGLGGELILPNKATTVNVQVDASSVVSGQRVELILDGNVIESQALTNSLQTYQWSVPLNRSGWIAAKTTGTSGDGAHTAATFALLGGCPIRNDPLAARNWKGYLDAYYELGVSRGEFGTSAVEVRQKVDEAKLVWEQIAQEGEGSVAMDCNAGTVLVANFMNGNTDFLKSRVYLWNPSQSAGQVTARVFTLGREGASSWLGTADLGTLEATSARNIKLEDILIPLGTPLPYANDGGNLTVEFTIDIPNVGGTAQVFSDTLAFGTYPLQEIPSTSTGTATVLVANFTNGNNAFLNSRVYLWNPSQSAGSVTVRAYTLPSSGPSALLGTAEVGLLGARSSLNIKIAEDVLSALGIPLPYTDNGGNLTIEVTVGAENVRGAAQVFSSDLAYGTYPLQVIQ